MVESCLKTGIIATVWIPLGSLTPLVADALVTALVSIEKINGSFVMLGYPFGRRAIAISFLKKESFDSG